MMIHADVVAQAQERRQAFCRKWRLKRRAVADNLEEAGNPSFCVNRGIVEGENQCAPPTPSHGSMRNSAAGPKPGPLCRDIVPMLLWALLPSDQVRKVDGWANLSRSIRVLNLALAV